MEFPGSSSANDQRPVFIFFADPAEAKFFPESSGSIKLFSSGVGKAAARRCLEKSLQSSVPRLVITSGFAGALTPFLKLGMVVFNREAPSDLKRRLLELGARQASVYSSDQVILRSVEKQNLFRETGGEMVEMESGEILEGCAVRGIPAVMVRSILDEADEDLAIDFNRCVGVDGRIRPARVLAEAGLSVERWLYLMRLRRKSITAARSLGGCLKKLLGTV